ncbi:hypothetical protein QQP08_023793 [Theobroma cacao]|uniref:Uncharacterized protein n=1 Tax=Theobroma cacao TaxID=3641 RepID=A0A061FGK3_THECC|nr:Uncharacterized protein TCM_035243 [Theobroma cacao]WRX31306.1 hypothetical protein QQP08_023793 [Theobroma cacao]
MMKMEQSLVEELGGGAEKQPRFKVKKGGVIPPKRRSVKIMMFDKLVKSVSSVFHACCHSASFGAASTSKPKNCGSLEGEELKLVPYGKAKNMRIFRKKDHLSAIASQNDLPAN